MNKVISCLLCNNKINEYNFREGYIICQSCYFKYKKNIKKFIVIGEPKFKPVILDEDYFRKPIDNKLPIEPITYFIIQEQTGLDTDSWEGIWKNISMQWPSSRTFNGQIKNIPAEPIIKEEPVKNYKRKIDLD